MRTVKLFEFGLARTVDSVLKDEEIAGSFCYMAPEVLLGQGKGTQFFKSDIYSMTMVVWELCTFVRSTCPWHAFKPWNVGPSP
jgi:serine/threonine protein kinase